MSGWVLKCRLNKAKGRRQRAEGKGQKAKGQNLGKGKRVKVLLYLFVSPTFNLNCSMKTFLRLFLLGTMVIFGWSCSNSKTNIPEELMVFDLAEAVKDQKTALASEFFSDVEFVVLDGKKEFYFPQHHITSSFVKNYSLSMDQFNQGSALGVFKKNGELLLSLNEKGKGPGEYAGASEFGMDYDETKIFVAEGYYKKIHWYDLSGNWLETIDIPTSFNHVYCLPDGNLLFQNKRYEPDNLDSCRLYICNPKGEAVKQVWNKSKEINDFAQFMDTYSIKRSPKYGLLYRDSPLYDTIYQINENYEIQPFFVMDPGRLRLPEDLATDFNRSDEWGNYLRANYYYFSGKDLLISASYKKKWLMYHVDFKSKEVTGLSEIKDDLLGGRSLPYYGTKDGNYLVHEIYVPYYKDHIDDAIIHDDVKFPEIQKQLREALLNAGDEVDMILIYYKLK